MAVPNLTCPADAENSDCARLVAAPAKSAAALTENDEAPFADADAIAILWPADVNVLLAAIVALAIGTRCPAAEKVEVADAVADPCLMTSPDALVLEDAAMVAEP